MWTWLYSYWKSFYQSTLRRLLKCLMHLVTGKCELLRIACSTIHPVKRTKQIEKSLRRSRNADLKQLSLSCDYNIHDAIQTIMLAKNIDAEMHMKFHDALSACLESIMTYNRLIEIIDARRRTAYDATVKDHEEMLLQLWNTMKAGVPLTDRVSNQWMEIGFQGNDPATDFRGMGLLGLDQLLYFALNEPGRCRHVLSKSLHPTKGYSYAIVGINLTSMLYQLLKTRALQWHFYRRPAASCTVSGYHDLYCYVFFEFDGYWTRKEPQTIMEFNRIREKFQRKFVARLKDDSRPINVAIS